MPQEKPVINNPELFKTAGDITTHRLAGIDIPVQVSSRPKRASGWACQDRAAISFLNGETGLNALERAYHKANEATLQEAGGCSATTLVIDQTQISVAWLGDSPAFLVGVNEAGALQEILGLNEPHIPLYEQAQIKARGGIVNHEGRLDLASSAQDQVNNYSLSMARALGNQWLGNLLNRTPSLIRFSLSDLSKSLQWYAVLGSDGILPESERSLMFPSTPEAALSDNEIITRSAGLFKALVNDYGKPWLTEQANWAGNVTQIAQEQLLAMEMATDKQQVGYPAVDDTTVLIAPLGRNWPDSVSLALTVADGHRAGGEVTAQKAVEAIHRALAT